MRLAPLVAMTMSLLATACSKDTQLDSIARELEATVNRCVIDVRDKRIAAAWPTGGVRSSYCVGI